MTDTATCGDCDIGWRGPDAIKLGEAHEHETGHVVWYDEDDSATETETTGPFPVVCD